MKTCEDFMTTNPIHCLPTDEVIKAAELMKHGNISSIPVIENEQTKKLIGIVTDRDLAIKVVADGRDPITTKVGFVMTRKVITCREDEGIQRAINAMSENQLQRIFVVDHVNKILGVITHAELAIRINQPE